MSTIPQAAAKPSQVIAHRHLQQRFNKYRHLFDKHRAKGPAFAAAIDDLEMKLFGKNAPDSETT